MTNQTPQSRRREPQSGVAIQSFAGFTPSGHESLGKMSRLRFARKDGLCEAPSAQGTKEIPVDFEIMEV